MKKVHIIFTIFCLIIFFTNCRNEKLEIDDSAETSFIIGDTSDNYTLVTFDSIIKIGGTGSPKEYSQDIDGDMTPDFEFHSSHLVSPGGVNNRASGVIILNPEIEISVWSPCDPDQKCFPMIYNEGETLNLSELWSHRGLTFSYHYRYVHAYPDHIESSTSKMEVWNNKSLKYLLFRIRINESYLYGWFQISVYEYNQIWLHEYAIQKNAIFN